MVDYSRWDNLEVSDDEEEEEEQEMPNTQPEEEVKTIREHLFGSQQQHQRRGVRKPAFVKLAPGDDGTGLGAIFFTDPAKFTPRKDPVTGVSTMWGLPDDDDAGGNPDFPDGAVMLKMQRRMSMQFKYMTAKTPEVQFIEALMARKEAALKASKGTAVLTQDLTIRVALAKFWRGDEPIKELKPSVWRRLRLSGGLTLAQVHDRVLGPAMGWTRNYHAYFYTDLEDGAVWLPLDSNAIDMMHVSMFMHTGLDPSNTKLGELLKKPGDRLGYTYDIGDHFEHILTLEEVADPEASTGAVKVLDGAMRCPNEDGNGNQKYQEEVLDKYPDGNWRDACRERCQAINCPSGWFDPGEFDVRDCQRDVDAALDSRASDNRGSKVFNYSPSDLFGGSQENDDDDTRHAVAAAPNLGPGATTVVGGRAGPDFHPGLTEAVRTRPDKPKERVCAKCGSPLNLAACAKCKAVFYCSKDCQVAAWPTHKHQCKHLAKQRADYKHEKRALVQPSSV